MHSAVGHFRLLLWSSNRHQKFTNF